MVHVQSDAHHGGTVGRGAPTVGRWHEEGGATAVEYGLLTGAIALGLVLVGPSLGEAFVDFLNLVLDHVLGTP